MFRYNEQYVVIGVDEVGRGALAGPVFACASFLNYNNIPNGLADSKILSKKRRNILYQLLTNENSGHYFGLGIIEPAKIDELNILNATMLAMKFAVRDLYQILASKLCINVINSIDKIIVDGNQVPQSLPLSAEAVVHGDSLYIEIAAASIVAKVARDTFMSQLGPEFTQYNFHENVGYGTKKHFTSLKEYGISSMHRKSFLKHFIV